MWTVSVADQGGHGSHPPNIFSKIPFSKPLKIPFSKIPFSKIPNFFKNTILLKYWYHAMVYLGVRKGGAKFLLATSAHTKEGVNQVFQFFFNVKQKNFGLKGGHGPMALLNMPLISWIKLNNMTWITTFKPTSLLMGAFFPCQISVFNQGQSKGPACPATTGARGADGAQKGPPRKK